MKNIFTIFTLLLTNVIVAQDFIRVGGSFNLGGGDKEIIQSLTFDLNRTEAKKEKDQNVYFLYSPKNFYILPVIDVNLGEKNKISENNIKSAFRFGKNFFNENIKSTYFFINIEPTYNSDKDFSEKLYYANINGGLKFYKDKEVIQTVNFNDSTIPFNIRKNELLFTIGTIHKIGERLSKTYDKNNQYVIVGGFSEFKYVINRNNLSELKKNAEKIPKRSDLKQFANWTFSVKPRLFYIIEELEEVANNNFTGFIEVSIEKSINEKISFSMNYKFGDDQPKYEEVNGIEFGFKYKFWDFK